LADKENIIIPIKQANDIYKFMKETKNNWDMVPRNDKNNIDVKAAVEIKNEKGKNNIVTVIFNNTNKKADGRLESGHIVYATGKLTEKGELEIIGFNSRTRKIETEIYSNQFGPKTKGKVDIFYTRGK
jgi:hypothetical protein